MQCGGPFICVPDKWERVSRESGEERVVSFGQSVVIRVPELSSNVLLCVYSPEIVQCCTVVAYLL